MKILLIEDDVILSELIEEFLLSFGYNIDKVFDANSADEYLYSNKYDLVIADINIPNGDGLSILESYRETGYKTPFIIITSITSISFIEKAFNVGCNDYLKKPFELKELKLRISNIEKIYNLNYKGKFKIDKNIYFDFNNMKILKEQKSIKIPKKEAEIIKYFIKNKNRIISIEELIINIWEFDTEPSISTIRTYIKNIRKIIGKNFIESIKGIGYRYTTF